MSVINYENEVLKAQQASDQATLDKANRAVYEELLNLYPIRASEGSYRVFLSFAGDGILTLAKCEHLLKNSKDLGFTIEMSSKEALLDELASAYADPGARRAFRNKAASWTLRQVRDEFRARKFRADHPTSASAREYLASVRPSPGAREPLGPDWTAERLRHRTDSRTLRYLIARHGLQAVNDRLAGRS